MIIRVMVVMIDEMNGDGVDGTMKGWMDGEGVGVEGESRCPWTFDTWTHLEYQWSVQLTHKNTHTA